MGPAASGGARWPKPGRDPSEHPDWTPGGYGGPPPDERPVPWVVVTDDVPGELKELTATLTSIEKVLDLGALRKELAGLEEQAAQPDLWSDQERATQVTSRLSQVQADLRRVDDLRRRLEDAAVLHELAEAEDDTGTHEEVEAELVGLRKAIGELEVRTLLGGEYDARDALVTVQAEAGGVDAADWAQMLLRMYLRWAERHGYPTEVYDTSYAEEAGIKSATFVVKAQYAYGTLAGEHGTHRLVRISPFDNQHRRQTSFAGVDVVPVVQPTDHIEIDDKDLRVDVYRSSGPGRPGREHDRLGGADHPPAHRHRGVLPERALPDPEPGQRDERAAGQAAGAAPAGGAGRDGRAARRRRQLLGQPDPQLRAAPVPDGQGPAHRGRNRATPRRSWTATSTSSSRPRSAGSRPEHERLVTAA